MRSTTVFSVQADEGCGTRRVFIRFQIDRQHDAASAAEPPDQRSVSTTPAGRVRSVPSCTYCCIGGLMDFLRAGSNVRVFQ